MSERRDWLPDLVAQTVGRWSVNLLWSEAPFLDEHEANFARNFGKALIETTLHGPQKTVAERKRTDYAFFTGLSPFYYLNEPEDARYLWALSKREGVQEDSRRVFRILDALLRFPEARGTVLRSMLALDLKGADPTSRDYVLLAVLEDDEGYRISEASRRKLAARIVNGEVPTRTKDMAKRLVQLAEAALARAASASP